VRLADSFHRGVSEARGGHIDENESEAKKNNDRESFGHYSSSSSTTSQQQQQQQQLEVHFFFFSFRFLFLFKYFCSPLKLAQHSDQFRFFRRRRRRRRHLLLIVVAVVDRSVGCPRTARGNQMAAAVKSFVQILSRQWKTREKRADRSFRAAAVVRTYEPTLVGSERVFLLRHGIIIIICVFSLGLCCLGDSTALVTEHVLLICIDDDLLLLLLLLLD